MTGDHKPRAGRASWIVIPARDEAAGVGASIDALDVAATASGGAVHLVVVDDGSADETAAIARGRAARWVHGDAEVLAGPAMGAGWARRTGLDHACMRALASGRPDALVATTDADSQVPAAWLVRLHALLELGHVVVAGDVSLAAGTDPRLVDARAQRLALRLADVRRTEPAAEHPHFAGSNLAFTAAALAGLGPLPTPVALEDDALLQRCRASQVPVLRAEGFAVVTSARTTGRATQGLATALAADVERLGL